MNKSWLSKERLLQYLLIVSIISVAIVGFYFLQLLTKDLLLKIFNAINAVLIPFVIAFFLSFIIGPLSHLIHQKLKIKRSIAIIIAILVGLIFIIGILSALIYFLVTQMTAIINSLLLLIDNQNLTDVIQDIIRIISDYFASSNISDLITEMTNNGVSFEKVFELVSIIILSLSRVASSLVTVLMLFILTPVFLFYLVKEKEYIFSNIAKIAPKKARVHMTELGKRSDVVIRNYFKGQGIMMLIIFVYFSITLGALSFFVDQFPFYFAIIFAVLMGLMNIIPYLGAWIGVMAPVVFLLTKHLEAIDTTNSSMYLIAIGVVIVLQLIEQALEGSVIQPNVLGKQVHIHPLAILSALLFFGGVFGFAGVLLAVPLTGTIKAALGYFSEINELAEKNVKTKELSTSHKEEVVEDSNIKKKTLFSKKNK